MGAGEVSRILDCGCQVKNGRSPREAIECSVFFIGTKDRWSLELQCSGVLQGVVRCSSFGASASGVAEHEYGMLSRVQHEASFGLLRSSGVGA